MATIRALSTYKHADYFNKRVVVKTKREDSEEKSEDKKETATVVKEIQAKQEVLVAETKTVPTVASVEKNINIDKPMVKKAPVTKKSTKENK
jgi:hypothetical protein